MLIYVEVDDGATSAVILNGVTIYHEDDDKYASNKQFTAEEVARRINEALGHGHLEKVFIEKSALPKDWNFDDIEQIAMRIWKEMHLAPSGDENKGTE